MPSNVLYLAVMPIVHVTPTQFLGYGLTEETLTLYPDRNFATEFAAEDVQAYVDVFEARANKYLMGGQVLGWEFSKEKLENGRYIVRVIQHVR